MPPFSSLFPGNCAVQFPFFFFSSQGMTPAVLGNGRRPCMESPLVEGEVVRQVPPPLGAVGGGS